MIQLRGGARIFLMILALGLLAGCEDTRKMLGVEKTSPDEFKIVSRAPLSLPPNYSLRPPQPGATRPQEQSLPQRALAVVAGPGASRAAVAAGGSSGESALMARVGVDKANPEIRNVLGRESSSLAEFDQSFLDRLMFWRAAEDRSPLVDAEREAQRLRENAALGRRSNEGDTPTVQRRKKAPLEGLF